MKSTLLLVDGDTQNLRVLEVSLKNAGYEVLTAETGEDALEKIEETEPSLIISDTKLPGMDGYSFCKQLKKNEDLASIPFIFLTTQRSIEDKIHGLELGVEDYLTKPIFVREIIIRIQMLLQKRAQEQLARDDHKTTFKGNLADMAVVDLIQTMEMGSKSGFMHFQNTTGQETSLYFTDGQIIHAVMGNVTGEAAIYRLLGWTEGGFSVEFGPVEQEQTIDRPNQALLMEGMRRVDEWSHLVDDLPSMDLPFEVDFSALSERLADIPDEMNAVLREMDGQKPLAQVLEEAEVDELEALTFIHQQYQKGLVYVAGQGPPPPPPEEEEKPQLEVMDEPADKTQELRDSQLIIMDDLEPPPPPPEEEEDEEEEELAEEDEPAEEEPPPPPEEDEEPQEAVEEPPHEEIPDEPAGEEQDADGAEDEEEAEEGENKVDKKEDALQAKKEKKKKRRGRKAKKKAKKAKKAATEAETQDEAGEELEEEEEEEPAEVDEPAEDEPAVDEHAEDEPAEDDEKELDDWLDDGKAAKSEERQGDVIPFPTQVKRHSAEVTDGGAVAAADLADAVNGAAQRVAKESGLIDPSDASINIRDEEFFNAEFEEEPIEEEFEEDPELLEDMRQFSARRWKALGLIIPMVLGCAVAAYFIMSSPYFGDGPKHLRVDRTALAELQQAELRRQAAAKRKAAEEQAAFTKGKKLETQVAAVTPPAKAEPPATEPAKAEPPATEPAKAEPPPAVAKTEPAKTEPAKTEPPPPPAKTEPPKTEPPPPPAKTEPPKAEPPDTAGEYAKLMADANKQLKRHRRARAYRIFVKAAKANPKGWEALQQMALFNMERGRMRTANKYATQALNANANAPYGHLVKGAYLDERGKAAAAKRAYRTFLRLCPKCRFAGEIRRAVR